MDIIQIIDALEKEFANSNNGEWFNSIISSMNI